MRAKRLWLLALAAITLTQRVEAQPGQGWQPLEPGQASSAAQPPQWEPVQPSKAAPTPTTVVWQPLPSGSPDLSSEPATATPQQLPQTEQDANNALKALAAQQPSGPTFANYRALWRDETWLPQISNIVPVGFGPKGVMLSLVLQGTDCHLGKGPCEAFTTYPAWKDSISTQANGEFFQALGFGDPIKAVSVVITNSLERLPAAVRSGDLGVNPLQGAQTGLHLAKAFGQDTSMRVGVENLITWNPNDYVYADMVRNFYAVASQRIRLNQKQPDDGWFNNLYFTAGVGNGDFKPIEKIFQDQTAALRSAGCATYGYTPPTPCSQETFKRALKNGSDYGQLYPIGSAALEVVSGLHLIAEWTGRNLNAGFSWRPIPELGLIITPMFNSLIQNCEYPGCEVYVPGYSQKVPLPSAVLTERARLSLQVSLEMKF
jgi:hypothetical protein